MAFDDDAEKLSKKLNDIEEQVFNLQRKAIELAAAGRSDAASQVMGRVNQLRGEQQKIKDQISYQARRAQQEAIIQKKREEQVGKENAAMSDSGGLFKHAEEQAGIATPQSVAAAQEKAAEARRIEEQKRFAQIQTQAIGAGLKAAGFGAKHSKTIIFLVLIFVLGVPGAIYGLVSMNLLPYSPQIRTAGTSTIASAVSTWNYVWCVANNLGAVTQGGFNAICKQAPTTLPYEPIISFSAQAPPSVPAPSGFFTTSLTVNLQKLSSVADNLYPQGVNVFINPVLANSSDVEDTRFDLSTPPECMISSCALGDSNPSKTVSSTYTPVSGYVPVPRDPQSFCFRKLGTLQLIPQYEVNYTYTTTSPSKYIGVAQTPQQQVSLPQDNSVQEGVVGVSIRLDRDFAGDIYYDSDQTNAGPIPATMFIDLVNSGGGTATIRSVSISQSHGSSNPITFTKCGIRNQNVDPNNPILDFQLSQPPGIPVGSHQPVSIACQLLIPQSVSPSPYNIYVLTPTISYIYNQIVSTTPASSILDYTGC